MIKLLLISCLFVASQSYVYVPHHYYQQPVFWGFPGRQVLPVSPIVINLGCADTCAVAERERVTSPGTECTKFCVCKEQVK